MIRHVDAAREGDLLAGCALDPVIGARIYTLCKAYGTAFRGLDFWLMESGGMVVGAISRFDGWLTFVADERADVAELDAFASAIGGFANVEGTAEICAQLHISGNYASSVTMTRTGESRFALDYAAIETAPPLDDLYHVMAGANGWFAKTSQPDEWKAHVSHLLRHELGMAALLRVNGVPVCAGGVFTMGERVAVIGGISTLPDFRGRGLAALMTRSLVDRILDIGKTPALFCASDSLAQYYAGFGFEISGRYGEIIAE